MSMENTISFEELERRRKKSEASRKQSMAPAASPSTQHESEAMTRINEIFKPSLKIPETMGHYKVPEQVLPGDLDALKDLDVRKLAELKEVFLLFDTDSDGLLSKDDLRFTFIALGNEVSDEYLEEMLKEAKEPLDYDAFVELMSVRTIELDPEDVLLEAWSKWDDYGTGKIDEKSCADFIEIFPYLRDSVIENSTNPEFVLCSTRDVNASTSTVAKKISNNNNNSNNTSTTDDLYELNKYIFSAARILGIRMRFQKRATQHDEGASMFNVTVEYGFLKRAYFRNDGRLIAGSFCDYYFFANPDANEKLLETWQYFHSPRFPANYPAHIKCSYKFIGRPETRVEIVLEELHIPRLFKDCNLDKLTMFDSESANMNAVIDVLCDTLPTRRIISSGPDLLIEFNASSNVTAKGFRGKFRFPQSKQAAKLSVQKNTGATTASIIVKTAEATAAGAASVISKNSTPTKEMKIVSLEKDSLIKKPTPALMNLIDSKAKGYKSGENCKQVFNSRNAKSGIFDTSSLFTATIPAVNIVPVSNIFPGRVQCRYEFQGEPFERIQIKFLEFNIPTEKPNSTNCSAMESLQLLEEVYGRHEVVEQYCGHNFPKPLMSSGHKLHLQFVGIYPLHDTRPSYYGFKAEYLFLKDFGIRTGEQQNNDCSFSYKSVVQRSGWFASPNFPGFYPKNLVCNYFFYGELEERVSIRFTYFDVEGIGTCDFLTASDFVEFSNFLSTDRKFAKFCGKRNAFEVKSDGRFFRVSFYSNDRFEKTGFRALYDFERKHALNENSSVSSFMFNGMKGVNQNVFPFITLSLSFMHIVK